MRRLLASLTALAIAIPAVPSLGPSVALGAPQATAATELVVVYRDDTMTTDDFEAISSAGAKPSDVEVRRSNMAVVKVPAGVSASAMATKLRRRSDVAGIVPNGRVRALETVPPNDTKYSWEITGGTFFYDQQTYLGPVADNPYSMDLETVWNSAFNGTEYALEPGLPGVTLGIIDTGVSPSVMENNGLIVPVWNYVANSSYTGDDALSQSYHGTRVASQIAAQTGNAYAIAGALGYTRSPLRVYKTLDASGSGDTAATMAALMDAADDGCRIVNASLGEPATVDVNGVPDLLQRAAWQSVIDYCVSKNTLVVAAAGNVSGSSVVGDLYTDVYYPGACDGALAIGSINPLTGVRSSFSCYGPELDLMAAGERVWTVSPNGIAASTHVGTSFAAPLVSGALGVLWSLVPGMSATQVASLATSTADPSIGSDTGFDEETGWGRFDASSMYASMVASLPVQAPVALTADAPDGLETTLRWTPAAGTNVHYRYGILGGPSYDTTDTRGRLVLTGDGESTVWVRSYADDRFDATATVETTVVADTGLADLGSTRLQGLDRYETSAMVSRAAYPGTVKVAVVASGDNWPDGLAASPFAYAAGGPLLLTRRSTLSTAVRDELLRLKPATIYIVGGTAAVSSITETMIRSLPLAAVIKRISGADRYETAAKIAAETVRIPGHSAPSKAVIASGLNYPDALAGAPLAAAGAWPVLLTPKDGVISDTSLALSDLGIGSTLVLGGEMALSPAVFAGLPSPVRIAGADRYATSRAIADWGISNALLRDATVGIATGKSFPDALAGGPLLAAGDAPLVLANSLDTGLDEWLAAHAASTDQLVLFGGKAAVPYDLEFDIKLALRRVK